MYTYIAKVDRIIDADTLSVTIDLGFGISFKERVRLARLNAPEIYGVKKESDEYKAGVKALDFVADWFNKHGWEVIIQTDKDKKGKYGRYIAEVYPLEFDSTGKPVIQNISLNETLVNEGHAKIVFYD